MTVNVPIKLWQKIEEFITRVDAADSDHDDNAADNIPLTLHELSKTARTLIREISEANE